MITVTKEEARRLVLEGGNVLVTWTTEGCPNCVYFKELMEELEKELESWTMLEVAVPFPAEDLVFEPSMYPTNFIFKDGVRKAVAIGIAPKEGVMDTLVRVGDGTFKSAEELEMEQLNALDEQK